MTKAIVFDMGGVLIDLHLDRCKKNFKEIAGFAEIDRILDACHQRGAICDLEDGTITEQQFYDEIIAHSNPGTTPATVRECLCSLVGDVPADKAALLMELKDKYPLYILSNNNPITMVRSAERFAEAGAPLSIFKEIFISSYMKLSKPSTEIYREAIRRIGLPPEEILFIDDSPKNVTAACSLGIDAVLFNPAEDKLGETVYQAIKP